MKSLKLRFIHWNVIGKYRNFFYKEFYLFYSDMWKAYKKKRNLENAKRIARANNRGDGRTYYVLEDYNGKFQALNKRQIERLKEMGVLSKHVNIMHLLKESAYIVRGNKDIQIIDNTHIYQKKTIFS